MNEDQARNENVEEGLEGRQDFRRGNDVPENRFGRDRAREYNTAANGAPAGRTSGSGASAGRAPRSEEEMREAVNRALMSERELAGANIQVEVHDGVILLRGRVQNARMRALAEDCLDEISYVHVIRNEIEVRAGARGFPSAGAPTGPVLPGEGLEAEPMGKRDGRGLGQNHDEPLRRSA
jgi:hypothetical protein